MEELELKDGNIIWLTGDIKKSLQEVYDHYRSVVKDNDFLTAENKRLKSEHYENEEISAMKEKYDRMKEDYLRGFPISEEEDKKIKKWKERIKTEHPCNSGAIGGRFTYHFTPTGIGVIGTVVDGVTGEKFNFQDLV